jgi:hypothetical protein
MVTAKRLGILLLFLFLAMPGKVCISQQLDPETIQADDSDSKEKKTDKKKDKNLIEIDAGFFISLGINILAVLLIISLIYYPTYKKPDYIFTFIMFNIVIFMLTFVLKYVKLSIGAAFGLFAVFSMLRYRTAGISMKDMTYLFVFIALGLISAIQLDPFELAVIDGLVFATMFIMDGNVFIKRELTKSVCYEKIELVKPESYPELIEDLKKRTGLNIHRITVNKINFLRDTASIKIYYYD